MNGKYGYLKDEYLELRHNSPKPNSNRLIPTAYTVEMIYKLREMAEKDIYPDIRFSDEEYEIWSIFHLLYSKES